MKMSYPAGTLEPSTPQKFAIRSAAGRIPTIVLGDEAVGREHDDGVMELLEQISQAARGPNARNAIETLLRTQQVDPALAQAEVYVDGHHRISDTIAVVAGSARVEASQAGLLIAVGKARVRARGTYEVWVTDDVTLDAYESVRVSASGHARVNSYDRVVGFACGSVQGTMRGQSSWTIEGNGCFFDTMDHSELRAGSGTVRAYGRSRVHAEGSTNVSLYDSTNGWFRGLVQAMLAGDAIAYTSPSVTVSVSGNARKMPLTA
jgi:hypothetical protein